MGCMPTAPSLLEERPAPTLEDARVASESAARRGAKAVWLFGSVARGESRPSSDIDIVVVFDDLGDYTRRREIKGDIAAAAGEACGQTVQPHVTDWPEWEQRTKNVTSSFESSLDGDLICLVEGHPSDDVDWGKEIKLPSTNLKEAEERLRQVVMQTSEISGKLLPEPMEALGLPEYEGMRMLKLCGAAGRGVETSLKTLIALEGKAPTHTRSAESLLGQIPDQSLASRLRAMMTQHGDVNVEQISAWHVTSNYPEDFDALWAMAEDQKTGMVYAAVGCAITARAQYVLADGDNSDLLTGLDFNLEMIRDNAPQTLPDYHRLSDFDDIYLPDAPSTIPRGHMTMPQQASNLPPKAAAPPGARLCGARTADGKRCRNPTTGGGRCHLH